MNKSKTQQSKFTPGQLARRDTEKLIVKRRAAFNWHPANPMPKGLELLLRVQRRVNQRIKGNRL